MDVSKYPMSKLEAALCHDRSAVEFVCLVAGILHLWDDLIDKDKDVGDDTVSTAFRDALITLPRNVFYAQNFMTLNPILANSITNWHIATQMERGSVGKEHQIAYILRSSAVDLITASATILGGIDHGIRVGYDIRVHAHHEGLDGYLNNLAVEIAARTNKE
jgi:hypothetical protein